MNSKTQDYFRQILTAWAADSGRGTGNPLPLPVGVDPREVCDILLSHQIHVALSGYIPAENHTLEFRECLASSRERTAFLLLELERILPKITWDTCQPVVLKGACLSQQYYAQPSQRWFLDLDILVPRGQVDEVCSRLETLGYHSFSGDRDPLYYELHHLHRIMVGPQGSCVEVHWDLTLPASLYGFDVPGVFNRAESVGLGRTIMLAASPVDQILHGVYQNIADGFLDLKRVLDLVLLAKNLSDEELLYLVKESQRTKMSIALGLSLNLMKFFCGFPVQEKFQKQLSPGWTIRRILKGLDVERGMLERWGEKVDGYSSLLHLLVIPESGEKFHEITRFVWRGEAELMDSGHWKNQLPGFGGRLRISLYFIKTLLSMSGRATAALVKG